MTRFRPALSRLHVWLGWLVGVPLLLWSISGLFMVSQPIAKVRGEHLKAAPMPLVIDAAMRLPDLRGRRATSIALEQRPGGAKWVIAFVGGGGGLADPVSGALLPPVDRHTAAAIARAAFAGSAALQRVDYFPADAPPLDLRRNKASWRASFADGTRLYVDAQTGSVLAVRTRLWRLYDFMWGLHIMDLQTREHSSHLLLIGAAALAVISLMIGLVLLPFRRRS